MGRYRFVDPEYDRLELSEGDWVQVRHRLSAGEAKNMSGQGLRMSRDKAAEDGIRFDMDPQKLGFARIEAYLLDWSFIDKNGKNIPISYAAICNLDVETVKEIDDALDAHIKRIDEEKKVPSGEPKSATTGS